MVGVVYRCHTPQSDGEVDVELVERVKEQMNAFMKVGLCSRLIRWSLTAMLWPVPGVW